MKILLITGCVYAENCNKKTFTGLDYIVSDIAMKLGEKHEVEVFTYTPYPCNSTLRNCKIVSYTYKGLLSFLSLYDFKYYMRIMLHKNETLKQKIKNIRGFLVGRFLLKYLHLNKFDIAHIHGISFSSICLLMAAIESNTPFVCSLHGLLDDTSGAPIWDREIEQRLLNLFAEKQKKFSVVSSGVKRRIESLYPFHHDDIKVILNALPYDDVTASMSIRDVYTKFNIAKGKINIICVGTICKRKNQMQLLRCLRFLPQKIKDSLQIILIGQDCLCDNTLQKFIEANQLEQTIVVTGFVQRHDMASIYRIADINVSVSLSEGFGLPILEAKRYGVPSMIFADMDAALDLYTEHSMMLITDKTDIGVARTLQTMLEKDWDRNTIKEEAKYFQTSIYTQYELLYNTIIQNYPDNINSIDILQVLGINC